MTDDASVKLRGKDFFADADTGSPVTAAKTTPRIGGRNFAGAVLPLTVLHGLVEWGFMTASGWLAAIVI